MKRLFLFLILIIITSCGSAFDPEAQQQQQDNQGDRDGRGSGSIRTHADEREVFRLVNDYRKRNGLAALKIIDQAILEAQYHSVDQERMDRLTHNGLAKRVEIIEQKENIDVRGYAENVGYNTTAPNMVRGWIDSFGHRRNILGNYTHTGIGRAGSGSKIYFTQIFLRVDN